MRSILVNGTTRAPIATVWANLADARSYSGWAMPRSTSLERTGSPTDDGVGAVRRFGTWPVFSREEVVVFDPPHRLSYVLLSGLPVVGYRADVELSESSPGVTAIRWSASFDVRRRWMGVPLRAFLTFVLKDFVRRLAKKSQADAAHPLHP